MHPVFFLQVAIEHIVRRRGSKVEKDEFDGRQGGGLDFSLRLESCCRSVRKRGGSYIPEIKQNDPRQEDKQAMRQAQVAACTFPTNPNRFVRDALYPAALQTAQLHNKTNGVSFTTTKTIPVLLLVDVLRLQYCLRTSPRLMLFQFLILSSLPCDAPSLPSALFLLVVDIVFQLKKVPDKVAGAATEAATTAADTAKKTADAKVSKKFTGLFRNSLPDLAHPG